MLQRIETAYKIMSYKAHGAQRVTYLNDVCMRARAKERVHA
jgi:hypothetical protein